MNNLLRAEWYKISRNKAFWGLVISVFGISALLHYLIVIDWWVMTGTPFEKIGLDEWNALAIFIVPLFFNILISTLAGFFISTEFSQQSVIKNQLMSGHKRSHIFLAKYIIFSFGAFIVTIVIPLITAIIVSLVFGDVQLFTSDKMFYLSRSYGLFTLQFLGLTAIVFIIAVLTEDSGRTILFTLLIAAGMFVIEKLVTNTFIRTIYEYTIFHQFNEVFNDSLTGMEFIFSITVGLFSLIVIIVIGMVLFQRKEIK